MADAINASAEAKAASISLPTGIESGTAAATTYYNYVQATVASDNSVTVGFTSAGEAVAQTSASNDVVTVAAKLSDVAASGVDGEASVSTVAGFYYSIESKASLTDAWVETLPRVLGDGNTKTVTVPNKGTSGFYRVKVSARSAD